MKQSRIALLIIILTFLIGACSTAPKKAPPPQTVSGSGFIKIIASPEDAEVIIDGEKRGIAKDFSVTEQALKVDSGNHKIELKKEGHYPYFREIIIKNDTVNDIHVTLNKR